ncbi:MAG: hypothetical protein KAS75_03785 [Planctomycetes bacterium]|nr:hypothetical protein [Planctomycetota bacterium]
MLASMVSFILRICLIGAFWAFVWQYIEPRTASLRLLRVGLLALGLLAILAALRITGQ